MKTEGKYVIAYDTICDGWQCVMTDDKPSLFDSEQEAFIEMYEDAMCMFSDKSDAELEEYEISRELVDEMERLFESSDIDGMKALWQEHEELNWNDEWVEPAGSFLMGRKAFFTGNGVRIEGRAL